MNPSIDSVFSTAFEIIEHIETAGGDAYVVGGAVRDFLSKRPVGDIDIATSEPPDRIQEIFEKVIPVGIEHGTVIVRHQSDSYEVTTYRTEKGYEDYRHPDEVTFVHDINEDLARRDFTMNAIAMDRQGKVIDPYKGREAIARKEIIAVGNPSVRFQEDPLRMMRAARFASQLNFTIEKNTYDAMLEHSPLLEKISIERIAEETIKLFKGSGYRKGIQLLESTGIIQYLPLFNQVDLIEQYPYHCLLSWPEVIVFYVHNYPSLSIKEWIKHWKLSNKTKQQTEQLAFACNEFYTNGKLTSWLVYHLPEHLYDNFARVIEAKGDGGDDLTSKIHDIHVQLPIHATKDLTFKARDLISMYPDIAKGPWISKTLESIEFAVVEKQIPNKYELIKEWVRKWNPPVNN